METIDETTIDENTTCDENNELVEPLPNSSEIVEFNDIKNVVDEDIKDEPKKERKKTDLDSIVECSDCGLLLTKRSLIYKHKSCKEKAKKEYEEDINIIAKDKDTQELNVVIEEPKPKTKPKAKAKPPPINTDIPPTPPTSPKANTHSGYETNKPSANDIREYLKLQQQMMRNTKQQKTKNMMLQAF